MTNETLKGLKVAVLVTDGFEEPELTEPVKALKDAGAQVTIISPSSGEIQGVRHDIDKTVKIKAGLLFVLPRYRVTARAVRMTSLCPRCYPN